MRRARKFVKVPVSFRDLTLEGSAASSARPIDGLYRYSTALKWYSIADILKTGMVTPDLCFKGKFHNKFNIVPKPGEFVFFVRTHNWHDVLVD